eukprot:jgi/Chlat1/2638/Chrsp178S02479
MVHVAFESTPCVEDFPLSIASLAAWGSTRLVIGTVEGALFLMGRDPATEAEQVSPKYVALSSKKMPAKKPIVQLVVTADRGLLLSLSEGEGVSVHALPELDAVSQLVHTRGCSAMAWDEERGMLCAAMKRRLLLYHFDGKDFVEVKELSAPDAIRSMVWCGQSLCLALKKEYSLVNVNTGAITEVFPVGRTGEASVLALPNNELLLSKDNIGMFLNHEGRPSRKHGLSWSEPPIATAQSMPYVLALLSRYVEVRSLQPPYMLVQTIPLRDTKGIVCSDESVAAVLVRATNSVHRLTPVMLSAQAEALAAAGSYGEAIALCELLPESSRMKEEEAIRTRYACQLFERADYAGAMQQFMLAAKHASVVLSLFPSLQPLPTLTESQPDSQELPNCLEPKGANLSKALKALGGYLKEIHEDLRNKQSATDDRSLACLVDTALLKTYLATDPEAVSTLVEGENQLDLTISAESLRQAERWKDLVTLYKLNRRHHEALKLLQDLGQQKQSDKPGKSSSLVGSFATADYLKQMGEMGPQFIVDHCAWLVQEHPAAALEVFTEVVPAVPPKLVMPQLRKYAPQMRLEYLESVLVQREEPLSDSPDHHNELAELYLEEVLKEQKQKSGTGASQSATRERLLSFLQKSRHYIPERMLTKFPADTLYEERCLLLEKIRQHSQALDIYARKLNKPKLAQEYCLRVYNDSTVSEEEDPDKKQVFLLLLKAYLGVSSGQSSTKRAPVGNSPMLDEAFALLQSQHDKIDATMALSLLPANITLQVLLPFIESVLKEGSERHRFCTVVRSLRRSENLQVREALIKCRRRSVTVQPDKTCIVCFKRIGTSVFAVQPDGSLVHFVCYRDRSEGPLPALITSGPPA